MALGCADRAIRLLKVPSHSDMHLQRFNRRFLQKSEVLQQVETVDPVTALAAWGKSPGLCDPCFSDCVVESTSQAACFTAHRLAALGPCSSHGSSVRLTLLYVTDTQHRARAHVGHQGERRARRCAY